MIQRWVLLALAPAVLIACTDSTAPSARPANPTELPLPEYAAQLQGDALLTNISKMIGKPQVMLDIDASLGAIHQTRAASGAVGSAAISSARLSLLSESSQDSVLVLTEKDLLAAVLTVTLDRIAQVNGDSAAAAAPSDPPPSP